MLSAVVVAYPSARNLAPPERLPEAVVRSLSALVQAAISDVVRDACIVGPPGQSLAKIADHAGCELVEDADARTALLKALEGARSDHVFLLTAGFAPQAGFIDEMTDWLEGADARPKALRRQARNFLERLFPTLAPVVGVVARKKDLKHADPAEAARALRAGSLRTAARSVV